MEQNDNVQLNAEITNEKILKRIGERKLIVETRKERKWKWLGHCIRRDCVLRDTIDGMVKKQS